MEELPHQERKEPVGQLPPHDRCLLFLDFNPLATTPRVLSAQIFPDAPFLSFGSQLNVTSSRVFPKATHTHTHTHTHSTLYHSLCYIFFIAFTAT